MTIPPKEITGKRIMGDWIKGMAIMNRLPEKRHKNMMGFLPHRSERCPTTGAKIVPTRAREER
jgi:hypothetical protein